MTPDLLRLGVAVGGDNAFAGTSYGPPHDGDTCHITVVDVLLSTPVVLAVRVAGINAAELSEPGGPEARDALAGLLPAGTVVTLRHVRPDKFNGRIVGSIITGQGVDVGPWLISQGFAVPWNGSGVKPVVPWPPPQANEVPPVPIGITTATQVTSAERLNLPAGHAIDGPRIR